MVQDNGSLTTLAGLDGLTRIGGSLTVASNDLLSSTVGLEALETVGEDVDFDGNGFASLPTWTRSPGSGVVSMWT